MNKSAMKIFFIICFFLLPLSSYASEESRYDWKTITYSTYLEDVRLDAVLVVSMKHSLDHGHAIISSMLFKVGSQELVFPKEILSKFGLIHPNSFSISAGDFSREKEIQKWVTVYFNYGTHPNIRDGSISFLNGVYKGYSIYDEPNS